MEELAEGQIRRGTVRSVMDFGAFVDLGGVDGLLHVSEMSFRRGVQAERVREGRRRRRREGHQDRPRDRQAEPGLKQAMADPWLDAATKYAVGHADHRARDARSRASARSSKSRRASRGCCRSAR